MAESPVNQPESSAREFRYRQTVKAFKGLVSMSPGPIFVFLLGFIAMLGIFRMRVVIVTGWDSFFGNTRIGAVWAG